MRIIVAPAMRSKFKYYQQKGLAEFFNTIDPFRTPIAAGADFVPANPPKRLVKLIIDYRLS
jgi:hypothetical protein